VRKPGTFMATTGWPQRGADRTFGAQAQPAATAALQSLTDIHERGAFGPEQTDFSYAAHAQVAPLYRG